jgi:hypothetical protein
VLPPGVITKVAPKPSPFSAPVIVADAPKLMFGNPYGSVKLGIEYVSKAGFSCTTALPPAENVGVGLP